MEAGAVPARGASYGFRFALASKLGDRRAYAQAKARTPEFSHQGGTSKVATCEYMNKKTTAVETDTARAKKTAGRKVAVLKAHSLA
jgi:hypothetical protein